MCVCHTQHAGRLVARCESSELTEEARLCDVPLEGCTNAVGRLEPAAALSVIVCVCVCVTTVLRVGVSRPQRSIMEYTRSRTQHPRRCVCWLLCQCAMCPLSLIHHIAQSSHHHLSHICSNEFFIFFFYFF